MPTFAAWAYKNAVGHPVNYPDNTLDYCSRFLKMMFALPAENYEVDPVVANALDKLLSYMPIMNRIVQLPQFALWGHQKQASILLFRPALMPCGARCMVVPIRK
jgi:hypothetical protein